MIVFSTIINGFKDWSSLTSNQSSGLLIMTLMILFFIGTSIYGIIKSFKNNTYTKVLPSLVLILVGFSIFNLISNEYYEFSIYAEIGGMVLLPIPASIYFYFKTKQENKKK